MYQATIIKFDRKTQTFKFWPLPPEQNIDAAQVNMVSPQSSHVDGKVWTQNNGFAGVHRLDIASGKMETWEPFKTAPKGEPHNIYDAIPDSKNNVYFTDFRQRHIGRIDAATGELDTLCDSDGPHRHRGAASWMRRIASGLASTAATASACSIPRPNSSGMALAEVHPPAAGAQALRAALGARRRHVRVDRVQMRALAHVPPVMPIASRSARL